MNFYFREGGDEGLMGEFVCVGRADFANDKILVGDQFLERCCAYQRFSVHRMGCFNAREVVEIFPDVFSDSFVQTDLLVVGSYDQVVEISFPEFCQVFLLRPLRYGFVGKCEAMALDGAIEAVRFFRGAVECAEFHHGLVVATGVSLVKK